MKHGVALITLASAFAFAVASPGMAHPGPHDDPSAARVLTHLFTDGFHIAQLGLAMLVGLAGLGAWRLARAARGKTRR